uniref:Uncharacterized protein n=1 Tax=Kalanchoe fedtschenkoi TaxID=63787 RepID=A0A7N0R8W1_KALFE
MERTRKDLLLLEHGKSPASTLEAKLLVCAGKRGSQLLDQQGRLETAAVPRSEVLGKVKDFLGVISEANKRLQEEAKGKASGDLDIEVLTGGESQYIEMDLMLGVTDLHTPEAVAAAESAISSYQPVIPMADGSDEDGSSERDAESEDSSEREPKIAKSKANTSREQSESKTRKSKKRPRILELP